MRDDVEQGGRISADEDAYVLPVGALLSVFWKRLWVIALVVITLTGGGLGLSLMQPPVYEASIEILVGQQRGIAATTFDVNGLQDVTATVAQAVSSRPIAEAVIEQENLNTDPETFLANLGVVAIEDTQFITVSYGDSDPKRAQRAVNAVGDVFSERIADVSPEDSVITATVWERAVVPDEPISPDPLRNGLVALMVGLVLGTGLAFLLEFLDDSWHSPAEAEQISGVPTFGVIPAFSVVEGAIRGAKVAVEDRKIGEEEQ
jgi:capsular polysaccharide biosynthesis protein